MAKIHRYSLSNMKTSVGHISESYKEEELRNLLFEANNNLEEDIEEDIEVDNNFNQNIVQDKELENVEKENLIIEKSVDLGSWVVIEVGQLPTITITTHSNPSSDDNDDDFDPKELAKEINKDSIDIENNTDNDSEN